jgi:hypothetical protein
MPGIEPVVPGSKMSRVPSSLQELSRIDGLAHFPVPVQALRLFRRFPLPTKLAVAEKYMARRPRFRIIRICRADRAMTSRVWRFLCMSNDGIVFNCTASRFCWMT